MEPSKNQLTFNYVTTGNRIREIADPFCDYDFTLTVDVSDLSTHQLFGVFEKVLAAMGYSEMTILHGACSLAFNEMRDPNLLLKLVKEYELDQIEQEVEDLKAKKEAYRANTGATDDTD